MRHILRQCAICIFAITISFTFVSCKSEEATKVDEMISEIGTVTLDSEQAIETTEIFYQALTEKQKEQVDNAVILIQARRDFDELWEQEQTRLKLEAEAIAKAEEEARMKAETEEEAQKAEQVLELAKNIVVNINSVSLLINDYADSLVSIWAYHMENAYELSTDVNGKSIGMLASFLHISEDEVRDAMSLAFWQLSDSSIENYYKSPEDSLKEENEFRELVQGDDVISAYYPLMAEMGLIGAMPSTMLLESICIKSNTFVEIEHQLETTEKLIYEIKNVSPEYAHNETIMRCYNELESYYTFMRNFQGDFSTISEKIIEHQESVHGCINVLEYVLSE